MLVGWRAMTRRCGPQRRDATRRRSGRLAYGDIESELGRRVMARDAAYSSRRAVGGLVAAALAALSEGRAGIVDVQRLGAGSLRQGGR
jgi:hypothetical protein